MLASCADCPTPSCWSTLEVVGPEITPGDDLSLWRLELDREDGTNVGCTVVDAGDDRGFCRQEGLDEIEVRDGRLVWLAELDPVFPGGRDEDASVRFIRDQIVLQEDQGEVSWELVHNAPARCEASRCYEGAFTAR